MTSVFEDNNSNESSSGGIMGLDGESRLGPTNGELLNAYKIRLEQQKMFLLFDTGEVQWRASTSGASPTGIECLKEEIASIPPAPPLPSTSNNVNPHHMQIDTNMFITVFQGLF